MENYQEEPPKTGYEGGGGFPRELEGKVMFSGRLVYSVRYRSEYFYYTSRLRLHLWFREYDVFLDHIENGCCIAHRY